LTAQNATYFLHPSLKHIKMSHTIHATYYCASVFEVPSHVKLLTIEENKKCKGKENVPGSWYISWDVLYYIDEDGNEQQLEPACAGEADYKRPVEIEETIEHTCKMCNETLTDEQFKNGKMCCDKPMFHDDHEETEE